MLTSCGCTQLSSAKIHETATGALSLWRPFRRVQLTVIGPNHASGSNFNINFRRYKPGSTDSCLGCVRTVLRASWWNSVVDFSWQDIQPSSAHVARYGYDEVNLNCGCPSSRVAGKGHDLARLKNCYIYPALHFAWYTLRQTVSTRAVAAFQRTDWNGTLGCKLCYRKQLRQSGARLKRVLHRHAGKPTYR